jgi:hypothetical protein
VPRPGDQYLALGSGITFVGAESPIRVGEGQIRYELRFLARRTVLRDQTVSLRLAAPGWPTTLQQDGIPALGALPTLKWVWGSAIVDRRLVAAPPEPAAGTVQAQMLLYDAFTQRTLPILDSRLAQMGVAVPVAP